MRDILQWLTGHDEKKASHRRTSGLADVEALEGRQLLSGLHATAGPSGLGGHHGPMEVRSHGKDDHQDRHDDGNVRKSPHFYEFYVGPQRQDLNVVAAQVRLEPGRGLVFRGKMEGKINTAPATSADDSFYVFGVNRGSPQAVAPFFNRPGISFDSVVVVSITHDNGISASVRDLRSGVSTTLSPDRIKIEGRELRVTVDPTLLPTPTGGKPLSQYTFNLWPRSSLANPTPTATQLHPSFVASFIPENGMAPIHVPQGHSR